MYSRSSVISVLVTICLAGCASAAVNRNSTENSGSSIKGGKIIKPVTSIKKPVNYNIGTPEKISFSDEGFECALYARKFSQGNAVYGEFVFKPGITGVTDVSFKLMGQNVPLTATSWGYRCISAISPQQKPGRFKGDFSYSMDGKVRNISVTVEVKKRKFTVSKNKLDLGRFSDTDYCNTPENKKLISECNAAKKKAFSYVSADMITSTLSHPRDFHKITGDYWKKRIYISYVKKKRRVKKKYSVSYHRGLDLKGEVGAPVYAMADGIVVLSREMFYEGNMVVIDHGNRIFSYYLHMEGRTVKEGDKIKAGEQIGRVGSTGMSTGPHLHVSLVIRGVQVDPLSLLWLPVSR